MPNESPRLDVLAVGAHPDDVEIACGGTLAKLVHQGYQVGIIDLTDGEPTPRCPSPEIRLEEARQAAQALGIEHRVVLDLPNRRLFDCFDSRVALAKEIRKFRPRIVIGFGARTPMASPDHWQAMQITDAAVFYSRLTKWPKHFDHLPEHTVTAQLYFRLAFEPFDSATTNQFVVDISETIEQKLASVACYQTQFPDSKKYVFDRIQAAAAQTGMTAGFPFGEQFIGTKALGTHDLVKMAIPDRSEVVPTAAKP